MVTSQQIQALKVAVDMLTALVAVRDLTGDTKSLSGKINKTTKTVILLAEELSESVDKVKRNTSEDVKERRKKLIEIVRNMKLHKNDSDRTKYLYWFNQMEEWKKNTKSTN